MTIEEILARKECQTFDCKSIQIDPKALAIPIVAMANADGGVLAIGVSDRTRRIEGIDGTIPSFHIDAFILKATLMAEWTPEKEFDRRSSVSKDDTINVQVKIAKLTDRQRGIYERIKNGTINDTINDTINAQTLSEAFGTSVITIKRDLYILRDMNLIHYVGSNKAGHWEVTNKTNK